MKDEVVCGDCAEVLSGVIEPADLLLTDPPYGISREVGYSEKGVKRFNSKKLGFGNWDVAPDAGDLATLASRCLRRGGTAVIFFDVWKIGELRSALEGEGFTKIRLFIWSKTNPVPIHARACYLSNAREVAVVGVKGDVKATFNSYYDDGVLRMPKINGRKAVHPTQKPLGLMLELVKKHSAEGDLVIDPYAGSGTTLVAAKQLGRSYIGIDVSAEYCELARARLAEVLL